MLTVIGWIVEGYCCLVVLWCLWSVFVSRKRDRRIKQRFYALVRRREQWSCARCRTWFYGVPQDGPVCDACKWQAFLEYLQEVA